MKKILLLLITGLAPVFGFTQTATNFNCKDCSSVNHDLFTELDAGKVVVIAWVMPCGTCIGPALSAYTEVQNYESSKPGKILFYLVDDYANTSCASLATWASTNGMGAATKFSNAAISMKDYGTDGMPKIVIIGTKNHAVYFNQNDELNAQNFKSALDQAIAASTVGIYEGTTTSFQAVLYPNPAGNDNITLSYHLTGSSKINVTVYNALGEKVKSMVMEKQPAGKHELELDATLLNSGLYYIKLNSGSSFQVLKFTVAH